MRGVVASFGSLRMLLALVLVTGVLSSQGGGGTLAFFTSSATSAGQQFTAGTLIVDAASVLPVAGFSWKTATFGGSNCSTKLATGTLNSGQLFAPGYYCTSAVDLANSGNLNMWGRLRLIRSTATGTNANEALNNRLIFYMHEYVNGTGGAGSGQSQRNTDCGTGNVAYTPSGSTSSGAIANVDPASNAYGRQTISRITTNGKVIGGTDRTSNGAHGTLGLTAQYAAGAVPSPANESSVANTFYNIIGTDAVDATGLAGTVGTLGTEMDEASWNVSGATNTRYYCAAIFFPSDTGISAANQAFPDTGNNDNEAQGGAMTYYVYFTGAQKSGR